MKKKYYIYFVNCLSCIMGLFLLCKCISHICNLFNDGNDISISYQIIVIMLLGFFFLIYPITPILEFGSILKINGKIDEIKKDINTLSLNMTLSNTCSSSINLKVSNIGAQIIKDENDAQDKIQTSLTTNGFINKIKKENNSIFFSIEKYLNSKEDSIYQNDWNYELKFAYFMNLQEIKGYGIYLLPFYETILVTNYAYNEQVSVNNLQSALLIAENTRKIVCDII